MMGFALLYPSYALETCRQTYERLRTSTAQQVLRFHRMQQTTAPAA
jgi:hypothetical protein